MPTPEPRQLQRWGLVDLIFAFLAVLGVQLFASVTGIMLQIGTRPTADGDLDMRLVTWISIIQPIAIVFICMFIGLRCRVKFAALGWSLNRWIQDLRLGVITFVVIAPPMYILMAVVTLFSGKEYSHPIQEMVNKDHWMLIPAILMAVALAPLGEEFVFRVLLQGFLESMSKGRFRLEKFMLGRIHVDELQAIDPQAVDPQAVDPQAVDPQAIDPQAVDTPMETVLPWWPVFVSGILFGLAHFEYGMSWVPLIVLGIVLGWLYRVTNRIWPSLIVHFLVNATSMTGFALTVLFGDPTKPVT